MTKRSVYWDFIIYFLLFGMCIIILSLYLLTRHTQPLLDQSIGDNIDFQWQRTNFAMNSFTFSSSQVVKTLANSDEVHDFLTHRTRTSLLSVQHAIKNMISMKLDYYRAEVLGKNNEVLLSVYRSGDDIINDKTSLGSIRAPIPQDVPPNDYQVWFSKISRSNDLFVKSLPFYLLEVSRPVYIHQHFVGNIIFYININILLNIITVNNNLDLYLTDSQGEIIKSSDPKRETFLREKQYFQDLFRIDDLHSEQQLFRHGFSMIQLGKLPNGQGLMLFSRAASEFLSQRAHQQNSAIIKSFLIVIVFSSVFGVIIAVNPSRTVSRLKKVSRERNIYMQLLDQYVPVFETDINGVITRCNQAFCLLSRYDESDLIGKSSSIFNYDQAKNNLSHIWGIMHSGLSWQGEVHYVSKQGKEFWLFSTVIPLYHEDRERIGYMSISMDKTDKKQLEILAEIDSLTEIYNRSKIDQCLHHEYERSQQYGALFSVIMIDVDLFKEVNDTYGHFLGDKVLYQLAILLNKHTRIKDEVGRWGGEEFMIVCPDTSLECSLVLAENIRQAIDEHEFPDIGHITVSIGVEVSEPDLGLQETLERADGYLYQAKKWGRNCVVSQLGLYRQVTSLNQ